MLEIESGTNDPIAVFLTIVLTEFILAGRQHAGWELALELGQQAALGACMGILGGFTLVALLNRMALPGGLHPLFVVAGHLLSTFTSLVGGSGLLAVYVAGIVMANRPTRAYPSIVGFHDAVTWLCQIVMFLVLGLLVTPTSSGATRRRGSSWRSSSPSSPAPSRSGFASDPSVSAPREALHRLGRAARGGLDLPRRDPHARRRRERRGLLQHRLLRGPVLHAGPGRLADRGGAAPRGGAADRVPRSQRVEIDVPGQTEQEIVGYPVTPYSLILGLSRLPAWARVVMVVRKHHILDAAALPLQAGDYCYFLVARDRLPRLDSLFRESPDVARRLGLASASCRSAARPGSARWRSSTTSTSGSGPRRHRRRRAAGRLGPKPPLDAVLTIPGATLVVRRLNSGRIASLGLQLDQMLQVEPDEGLLAQIEEEADELGRLRRWLARLRPRRSGA